MRTVRIMNLPSFRDAVTAPTMVRLEPPVPIRVPRAPEQAKTRPPTTIIAPTVIPPPVVALPDVTRPTVVAAPVAPVSVADSSTVGTDPNAPAATGRRITDLISTRVIPTFPARAPSVAGAPMAPAGVTVHSTPLSVAQRDSIITAKLAGAADWMSDKYKPTEEQIKQRATQVEPGRALPGTRAAGEAPLMNGGSAVRIPILTISAPFLTRKPVPPEPLEIRLLRERLADRAIFLRDSLRADSIAKSRIRP
jgi:hypothetical protein